MNSIILLLYFFLNIIVFITTFYINYESVLFNVYIFYANFIVIHTAMNIRSALLTYCLIYQEYHPTSKKKIYIYIY